MAAFRTLLSFVMLSSCSAANFVMFPVMGRSHYMFVGSAWARTGRERSSGMQISCTIFSLYFILPAAGLVKKILCTLATLQQRRSVEPGKVKHRVK